MRKNQFDELAPEDRKNVLAAAFCLHEAFAAAAAQVEELFPHADHESFSTMVRETAKETLDYALEGLELSGNQKEARFAQTLRNALD